MKGLDKYDLRNIPRRLEDMTLVEGAMVSVEMRATELNDRLMDVLARNTEVGVSFYPQPADEKPTVTDPGLQVPFSPVDILGIKRRRDALPIGLGPEILTLRPGDRYRSVYHGSEELLSDRLTRDERWKRMKFTGAVTPLVDRDDFNHYYEDLDIKLGERLHRILHSPDTAVQLPREFVGLLRKDPQALEMFENLDGALARFVFSLPVSKMNGKDSASMFEYAKNVMELFIKVEAPRGVTSIPFLARLHQSKRGVPYRPNQGPISSFGFIDRVKDPLIGRRKLALRVLNEDQGFDSVDLRCFLESPEDLIEAGLVTRNELAGCSPETDGEYVKTYLEFMLFPPGELV